MNATKNQIQSFLHQFQSVPLKLAAAMTAVGLLAAPAAWAGSASLKANDASGTSSFTGSTNWSIAGAPNGANDYYTSTFYMRTPPSSSATTYTFGGNSLTLQAFASANARSMIFKGANGDVLNINNFTNAAGALINEGSGTFGYSIGGNLWTIAGNSAIWCDQFGPVTINSPLAGSANFTNLAYTSTITYSGTNSAFTGKLVMGSGTIIFNSVGNVLGNPASLTPDQYTLGASTTLQDNKGVTINAANSGVTLAGAATINTATAGSNTVIAVPIAGAFALTKSGAGTLTLAGSNSFTGGLTFTAGQLNINSTNALGTGTLNINGTGAVIDNTSGGAISNANNNAISISTSFTNAGSYALNLGAGSVNNGSLSKIITVSAGTLTFGGAFTGSGQLIKAGGGTLALGGASTGIGGGLVVSNGAVLVDGSTASGTAVTTYATLGGTGTVSGNVTINNGAILNPGDSASVRGPLTLGGTLALPGTGYAPLTLDLDTAYNGVNDHLVLSAAAGTVLTISGSPQITINVANGTLGQDSANDYVLINAPNGAVISGSFSAIPAWGVSGPPANSGGYTILTTSTQVTLHYSASTPPVVGTTIFPGQSRLCWCHGYGLGLSCQHGHGLDAPVAEQSGQQHLER